MADLRHRLADIDWVITRHGDSLHHPDLPADLAADLDDDGTLGIEYPLDDPIRLDCGRQVPAVLIPGLITRLGANRCARCCTATGLPPGKGSPKNSAECRALLGLDKDTDHADWRHTRPGDRP